MNRVLNISILIVVAFLSSFGHAQEAVTLEQAEAVKAQTEPLVAQLQGLNGFGITGCDIGTDKQDFTGPASATEYCLQIGFLTDEQRDAAKALFKSPLAVNGVYFVFVTRHKAHI